VIVDNLAGHFRLESPHDYVIRTPAAGIDPLTGDIKPAIRDLAAYEPLV
jgi:hypothetical protein